jgi:hypothetical protein
MALWQAQTGQVQGLETVHVDLRDSWKANTATIHLISPKRVVCGEHVARRRGMRNAYKISERKLEDRLLGIAWYTSRQQGDSRLFLQIYRGNWFICLKYGAAATVVVRIMVFRAMTPFSLVDECHCFRGTSCLHLQGIFFEMLVTT